MKTVSKPPLAIHFVWHPSDIDGPIPVLPVIELVQKLFARDVNKPFSRGLNIPLFFYSSDSSSSAPENIPMQQGERDVVFIFASIHTAGEKEWKDYIEKIFSTQEDIKKIFIAIDKLGYNHNATGVLKNSNFIRGHKWKPSLQKEQAVVEILHEIYRHGLTETKNANKGIDTSIKFFLSHAKADKKGRDYAEAIKHYIDNTNMSNFFDTTDISPGFRFDNEIKSHIEEATLLCIRTDSYHGRYWCQREILHAKKNNRPIISLDCLEEYEDRVFPASSNVPLMHVSHDENLGDKDIMKILTLGTLETIRHVHSFKCLNYYKQKGWIDNDCALSTRPPEIRQVIDMISDGQKKICYPEPALYSEEMDWLKHFEMDVFTPLWHESDSTSLFNHKIGISISDFVSNNNAIHHLPSDQLEKLAQDLTRHFLARSATLLYGGDLRNENNFTRFILEEACVLKDRLKKDDIFVENYLSWPIYLSGTNEWVAKYEPIIKFHECDVPSDILSMVDPKSAVTPRSIKNKYIWSRCLTDMRMMYVDASTARVCAGGKYSGYVGRMPGILEEFLISIEKDKPIYLIGAFGGITQEICKSITEKSISEILTEDWQAFNNEGYAGLQDHAKRENREVDYRDIANKIVNFPLEANAKKAGLDSDEYKRLMETPFIDESVHLIIKGLKALR